MSAFQLTNLCVAHTMTRQPAAAVQSCNEAIDRERSRWNSRETRTERHAKLAWAHTNRAVALWMAGDRAAAEIDLATAISYARETRS